MALAKTDQETALANADQETAFTITDEETAFTITDEETCRLARELADLTGEPLADVIALAIDYRIFHEKLFRPEIPRRERIKRQAPPLEDGLAKIRAIFKRFNKDLPPGPSIQEYMDDMYDEYGLPK